MILCHEISHAIDNVALYPLHHKKHNTRNIRKDASKMAEIFILDHQEAEAGFMWETIHFGGKVNTQDRKWTCLSQLERKRWQKPKPVHEWHARHETLPPWYLNIFQLPVFWTRVADGQYSFFLHQRGMGIKSIGDALTHLHKFKRETQPYTDLERSVNSLMSKN